MRPLPSLVFAALLAVPVRASRHVSTGFRAPAAPAFGAPLQIPLLDAPLSLPLTLGSLPEPGALPMLLTSVSPPAFQTHAPEAVPRAIPRPARRARAGAVAVARKTGPPVRMSLFSMTESLRGDNRADAELASSLSGAFDGAKSGFSLPVYEGLADGLDELQRVGILAVDLKDSTRLYREEGVKRGYRAVHAYLEYASQVARKYGGSIVRHTGDGYAFLLPDVASALDAAVELQGRIHLLREAVGGRALSFRAGVYGGRVIVHRRKEGVDAYGQSLERAFRYLGRGAGDDIALSEEVYQFPALEKRLRGLSRTRKDGVVLIRPLPAADSKFDDALPGGQRELTNQSIQEAATMFTSLKDWTSTYDEFGRRKSYVSIRAYQDYVRRIVSNHNGAVVKTEGEGVMISFSSARDSLLAAVEIQREIAALRGTAPLGERIAIQIGVSYGRVVREDYLEGIDFFGNTVNAAARLMKHSRGGDILVSRRLAADPAAARIIAAASAVKETMALKGFGKPIEIYRIKPDPVETSESYPNLAERLARGVRKAMDAIRRLRDRERTRP